MSTAIEFEARRLARKVIKEEIVKLGNKVSDYDPIEIIKASKELVKSCPEFLEHAKHNFEWALNNPIQITSIIHSKGNGTMTTFSPVTESEMNEFFARISATVRDYTQLSDRLADLDRRNTETNDRLTSLVTENETLRNDIRAAADLGMQAEQERDEARRNYQAQTDRSNHLQNLITARDSRVAELTIAKDEANSKASSLDRECATLNDRVVALETQLRHTADRRDFWSKQADEYLDRAEEAEAALVNLEVMLSKLGFVKPKVEEPAKVTLEPDPITTSSMGIHPIQITGFTDNSSGPEMKPVIIDEEIKF